MKSLISTRIVLGFFALALAIAGTQFVAAALQNDPSPGKWIELSFRLPAIGNVDKVAANEEEKERDEKEAIWTYGRLVNLSYIGNDDVAITIRTAKGPVQRVICPKIPFHALAQVSSWMRDSDTSISAKQYTERMVAFAADETGRVIAMVSLEPLPRDGKRIAKAYDARIR